MIVPLLLCVALLTGCGTKRPDGLPKLYGCVLTIQYDDGSPVADAMVSLMPDDTEIAKWGYADTTDSSGVANIHAHGNFPGAPAGTYKVLVKKIEGVETGKLDESGAPLLDTRFLVAEKFSLVGKTPLTLEIKDKAVNETFKVERTK